MRFTLTKVIEVPNSKVAAQRSRLQQSVLRRIVKAELRRRRESSPRYSLRAFARDLKFNSSHLSEILNGKRALSLEAALRLVQSFSQDPETVAQLQNRLREKPKKFEVPEAVLRNPVALAVLALLRAEPSFDVHSITGSVAGLAKSLGSSSGRSSPTRTEGIARDLGIKKSEVDRALRQLRAEKLVAVEGGELVALVEVPVCSMSAQQGQAEQLEFSSLTVCVDPRRIAEAARKIDDFMKEMREFFDVGAAATVYELQIQLYPWAISESGKKSRTQR